MTNRTAGAVYQSGRTSRCPMTAPSSSLVIPPWSSAATGSRYRGSRLPPSRREPTSQDWLIRRLTGTQSPAPFHYSHAGNLATIGCNSAILDFGWLRPSGMLGWLIWGGIHIFFLIGFRNRMIVALGWLWSYFTSERGARLITGSGGEL